MRQKKKHNKRFLSFNPRSSIKSKCLYRIVGNHALNQNNLGTRNLLVNINK